MNVPSTFPAQVQEAKYTIDTLKASFQCALARRNFRRAKTLYHRLCSSSEAGVPEQLVHGYQLLHHYLAGDPPELRSAHTLLDRLEETAQRECVPAHLRKEYEWWRLVLHIADGASAINSHKPGYAAWRNALSYQLGQVYTVPPDATPLFQAVGHLLRFKDEVCDSHGGRVIEVMSTLTENFRWSEPGLLRGLQLYRVSALRRCGRYPEALSSLRPLLALSADNAADWSEAVHTARAVMREAGWKPSQIVAWSKYVQWGPAGPDGRIRTEDDCVRFSHFTLPRRA
jgi:hypothetical protein